MILTTDRKILPHPLILLAVCFLMISCGKKAPPQPPGRGEAPAAVGNISKIIRGNILSLTWIPIASEGGDVAGFYVYRSKMRLTDSDCRTCPVLFTRVAVIPYRGRASGETTLRPFEYRETLESGYRYIYKVAAYSQNGSTGKDSNTVDFIR